MQIFHFGSDGGLISKIQTGYVTQYSDKTTYLFCYIDGATPTSDYVATAVFTPNGAQTSVTLNLSAGTQTIDGETIAGWYLYLPASVLQIAGPMALSVQIANQALAVLATASATIYVTATASTDVWDNPITFSQWQELVSYILGMTGGFLGALADLTILDSLTTDGSYWYIYNGNPYSLRVVGSGSAATQTRVDYLTPSDTISKRTYASGAWGAWQTVGDFSGYLPLTGGLMSGDITFTYSSSTGNGKVYFVNPSNFKTLSFDYLGIIERKYSGSSESYYAAYLADNINVRQGGTGSYYNLYFPYKSGTFALTSDVSESQTTLQAEIDSLSAAQNLADIVGTYAALQALPTAGFKPGDKVEVMSDSSYANATTIYSWTGTAWSYVGLIGPYYTKSEADARYLKLSGGTMADKAAITLFDTSNTTNTTIVPGSIQLSRGGSISYTEYGPSGIDTYVNDAPALSFALPSQSGTLAVIGQVGLLAGNNAFTGNNTFAGTTMFGQLPTYNSSPLLAQSTLADFVDSSKATVGNGLGSGYTSVLQTAYKSNVFNDVIYLHALWKVSFTGTVTSGTTIEIGNITGVTLKTGYRGTLSFGTSQSSVVAGSGTDGAFRIDASGSITRVTSGAYTSGSVIYVLINAVICN